ncbi:MAG: diguanylate cyclase, partial [Polyangiales bacterium]
PGAGAAVELRRLIERSREAREVLDRLHAEIAQAEQRLAASAGSALVEANEHLVVATLQAQSDKDSAAAALDKMAQAAELDALTQLPNRMLLHDRFAHAIAGARRRGDRLAVLFLDLDDFKHVNDTLGHAAGDDVLRRTAHCIASTVRACDLVSRHGGDEFLVLLEIAEPGDASCIAAKIVAALATLAPLGDPALRVTASVGVSLYPDDADNPADLIALADAAMYRAKRGVRGGVVFHGASAVAVMHRDDPDADRRSMRGMRSAVRKRRHPDLRTVNEQLVLSALAADEVRTASDATQRRQTVFLAMLAHELRNPLAPLRTAAALLGGAGADASVLPRIGAMIERQVGHMVRLVGDLLDISRVSTGKLRLELREVDLVSLIEDAAESLRPRIDSRRQRLRVDVDAGPLPMLGDDTRIAQVMCNLLDNASKYSPEGSAIELEVSARDGTAVITVTDHGIGIAPDALPAIFELFVQAQHAIAFNSAGLGIGLTVVRDLVEAHGGTVKATSPGTGLGSRFEVTLPLLPGAPTGASGLRHAALGLDTADQRAR